jgi:hypothetical protein
MSTSFSKNIEIRILPKKKIHAVGDPLLHTDRQPEGRTYKYDDVYSHFFNFFGSTAIKSGNLSSTKNFLQDCEIENMFWTLFM